MRSLALIALSLLTLLGAFTSTAPAADPQFCRAYAQAAVASFLEETTLGCGYKGALWHKSYDKHYAACMGWKENATTAENQTITRRNDLLACIAKQANQSPDDYLVTRPVEGSQPATLDTYCRYYSIMALDFAREKIGANNCGFTGDRWDRGFDHHRLVCVGWGDEAGNMSTAENIARTKDVVACGARLATTK